MATLPPPVKVPAVDLSALKGHPLLAEMAAEAAAEEQSSREFLTYALVFLAGFVCGVGWVLAYLNGWFA